MKSKIISLILCAAVFGVCLAAMFRLADVSNAGSNANGNMNETTEKTTEINTGESGADSVFTRDSVIKAANDIENFITRLSAEKDKEYKESLADIVDRLNKASAFCTSDLSDAAGSAYFGGVAAIFKEVLDNPFADASSFSSRIALMENELEGLYPTEAAAAAEADTEHEIKMHYPKFDTEPNGSLTSAMLAIFNQQKKSSGDVITVSFGGNLVLGDYISNTADDTFASQYSKYGSTNYPLYNMTPIFATDDLSIVNLQSPLTSSSAMTNGISAIKGDSAYSQMLSDGSIELAALTGSHIGDYGSEGVTDTVKALSDSGVLSCTTDSKTAFFTTESGKKIAVISYNMLTAKEALVDEPKADIASAKDSGADVVITVFNWLASGSDDGLYNQEVDNVLPKTARSAIDNGANLVLGSGPHVIMGMENYEKDGKKGTIVYSPGDLSFAGQKDAEKSGELGYIFRQSFTLSDETVTPGAVEVYPIKTSSAETGYAPTLLFDASAQSAIDRIVQNSKVINKNYRITAEDITSIVISK